MSKLFPHECIREEQADFLLAIEECLKEKKHLIAHAPTGLGKTAAVLAPVLEYAIKNEKNVFFLTSKHTQHLIAVDTLQKIRTKYQLSLAGVNIIGKKWMCLQTGADTFPSGDFTEFCKKLREDNQCQFYSNLRKPSTGLTVKGEAKLEELKARGPLHSERLIEEAKAEKLCPYYLAENLAERSQVIITDYAYIFNPYIREAFLAKIRKPLENSILIVDEGHNLPERVREVLTSKLSNGTVLKAMKEAEKFSKPLVEPLGKILNILEAYGKQVEETGEKIVKQESFIQAVNAVREYDLFSKELLLAGDMVREEQKQSSLSAIGKFLEQWKQTEQQKEYARIFSIQAGRKEPILTLSHRCLDPSLITKEVIQQSYCTILMSGTLTPTSMYKDILGFPDNTREETFESPFDAENKLSLIVPETTTKFSMRNDDQYLRMAEIIAQITNQIPGNSFVFFPSYALRDSVYRHLYGRAEKTCFLEQRNMTKQEKVELLDKFKQQAEHGAVLLGAISGNFAEGIDLPGDLLKGVIVVGLPLAQPDLETKELISFFEERFGKEKGWDYGYVFPAFTKCLQSAGRCIRTETDRGVIVFLDARYAWPRYARCFPRDSSLRVSMQYQEMIAEFFDR